MTTSILPDVPFVDYAGFSFPESEAEALLDDVIGHALLAGGCLASDDDSVSKDGVKLCYWGKYSGVQWMRITGSGLRAFREQGNLEHVIGCINAHEHKVTQLHIALDIAEHAPRRLGLLQRRVRRGNLFLTQKAVKWWNTVKGPCPVTSGTTGTLYLGKRTSDVWAKVYDKRAERINKGFDDPGPLTRYELSLGRHTNISLADLANPAPAFWHHMSRPQGVLPSSQDVPEWEQQGSGYHLPPREPPDVVGQCMRLLDCSADLQRLKRLLAALPPTSRAFVRSRLVDCFTGV